MSQEKKIRILRFIRDAQEKAEPSAVIGDKTIADGLGISLQEVQDCLDILEREGKIKLGIAMGPTYRAVLTAEGREELRQYKEETVFSKIWSWVVSLEKGTGVLAGLFKNAWFLLGVIVIALLTAYRIYEFWGHRI